MPLVNVLVANGTQTGLDRFVVASTTTRTLVAEEMVKDLDDNTIYKIIRGNAIRMLSLELT